MYNNYIIYLPTGKIIKQRYSSKEIAKKANLIARSIFLVTQS